MCKCVLALLFAVSIPGWPDVPSASITQAIEKRYNSLRSLKVDFTESVSYSGRNRRVERGTLYLLRPRKMRWEYTDPAGKLFVFDSKMFYLYSPNANQVQKIKPKEVEDLRAPLAFLLGKLNFQKEFGKLSTKTSGDAIELTAEARTPQESYTNAVFTVNAQTFEIRRIVVNGQDAPSPSSASPARP